MRVQALETARAAARSADAHVELGTQRPLLRVRLGEARRELGLLARGDAPPFDAAGGLEPRYLRHRGGAGQPKRCRKRFPVSRERRLLRYGRSSKRAADDDAPEGARLTSELPSDDRSVIVHARSYCAPAATRRFPGR